MVELVPFWWFSVVAAIGLGKLGTLEKALIIVKQEVAQCCAKEGRQGMAYQLERQRCETGTPSHPYLVLLV